MWISVSLCGEIDLVLLSCILDRIRKFKKKVIKMSADWSVVAVAKMAFAITSFMKPLVWTIELLVEKGTNTSRRVQNLKSLPKGIWWEKSVKNYGLIYRVYCLEMYGYYCYASHAYLWQVMEVFAILFSKVLLLKRLYKLIAHHTGSCGSPSSCVTQLKMKRQCELELHS